MTDIRLILGIWLMLSACSCLANDLLKTSTWLSWGSEQLGRFQDPLQTRPPELILQQDRANLLPEICTQPAEGYPISLTLLEAIDMAICRNPQAKIAWINIQGQAASLGEARAAYFPTVLINRNLTDTETSYPQTSISKQQQQTTTKGGNINWRIWDFGRRGNQESRTENLLEGALHNHELVLRRIINTVSQEYITVLASQKKWRAKQEEAHRAQQIYQAALRRQKHGAVSQSDVLLAHSAWMRAQLGQQEAKGAVNKAQTLFQQRLGLGHFKVVLAEIMDKPNDLTDEMIQEKIKWAQENHPSILVAKANINAAKANIHSIRAEGMPYIDATMSLNNNLYEYPNQSSNRTKVKTYSVNMVMPLFDGFLQNYKIIAAQAQLEQKLAELTEISEQVHSDLSQLYADWQANQENVRFAKAWINSAELAAESAKRQFEHGLIGLIEVLQIEQQRNEAIQEHDKHLANANTTYYQLWFSLGGGKNVFKE